jgi:hypothetical protein
MDLVQFCKRVQAVIEQDSIALPLAVIGWARTEGDPEASGRLWHGAFGVSEQVHGEVPVELDDQIRHAAGILRSQEAVHKLDGAGLLWAPSEPVEPILGPQGTPVPGSDRLLREIERCAAFSLGWDAPADMAQAVGFLSEQSRPVTYDDIAAAMAWRHDPQPHFDAAETVIRDALGVWNKRAPSAKEQASGRDWGTLLAGAGVLGGLFWLIARAR